LASGRSWKTVEGGNKDKSCTMARKEEGLGAAKKAAIRKVWGKERFGCQRVHPKRLGREKRGLSLELLEKGHS